MMGEKVFTMGLAMVVSVFVTRYLGPEKYGILSYAVSLTGLFAIATHMGLSGLAVREFVKYPEDHQELLGTILGVKFVGAILAIVAYLGFVFWTADDYELEFWVLILVSGTILINPFEVFDYWFQAKVMAKYSSLVRGISTIILSIIKLILVYLSANLLAFASVYLIQAVLIVGLFAFFFSKKARIPFRNWKFSFKRAKMLMGQGWMIMVGALFAMIYLKIDQVMIRWLVDVKEVGIYSVAVQLSEAWYFIPGVIVASLFPKLIELKNEGNGQFENRFQQLLDLLFLISFLIAVVLTFIARPLIEFLYGVEFIETATILSIHIWAGIFIFMRAAFSKWILVEDAIAFSMITQGAGGVVNILLNLILIPLYGGVGAAIATIISYAMASYLSLLFYKKSRVIFWMMTKAIFSPVRYLIKL